MRQKVKDVERHIPGGSSKARLALGLLVSGGLVAWLALGFQWDQVFAAMTQARPGGLLLAVLLFTLAMATRARAWQVLLGPGVPFGPVFWSLAVGFLFTTLLPFRLGEAARVVALHQTAGVSWSLGISSVAVARLADAGLLALTVLALAPRIMQGPEVLQQPLIWVVGAFAGMVGGAWLVRRRRAWLRRLRHWAGERTSRRRWVARLEDLAQALEPLERPGTWLRFLGWKGLTWTLIALEHYVLLRMWFPEATLLWAYWVVAVASLGVALPSAPGHVGTVQAGILAALWPLQVDPNQALALSLVKHGIYLGVTTILGLVGLSYTGLIWGRVWVKGQEQAGEEKAVPGRKSGEV